MRNTLSMISSPNQEARSRRTKLGLGLRNGLLIGLALALGTWGLQAFSPSLVHVRFLYPPLILGGLALLVLGALGGVLTAWFGSSLAGLLIWTVVAVLMTLVISHVPYEGYNLTVWLADRRSWGLPILPYSESAQVRVWLSGFFIVLLLAILGLFQDYRLEGLEAEVSPRGRLSGRGWFLLLLPLPLVLGAGLIADNIVNSALRGAPGLVQEAISTARTYRGNLFELSLEKGFNYNAIAAVREQLSPNYSLQIGEANLGAAETVVIVADFDNGAWIYCFTVAGNLSNCYDASPPYVQGLTALLTAGEFPEDCPRCKFRVSDELREWLAERGASFSGAPQVTRLGQWGSYVLMRAETSASSAEPSPSRDYAIECRFHGIMPVELEECWEVEGSSEGAAASNVPFATITPSSPATRAKAGATTPEADLTLYAQAMRPDFETDLTSVGPVAQYRIEATVSPENAQVHGQETVQYVNTAPVTQDTVYFRLFPNLPGYGGDMTVSDVRVEGEATAGSLEAQGTALRVPLATPLLPGEEATITLSFTTTVPLTTGGGYRQLVYQQDVMALANFFPLMPAYDEGNCARFGNCDGGWNIEYAVPYGDAVFSPTALFDVFVTGPADWTIVASGSTIGKESGPEDTVTWHIVSGPMRDFNVVLSPRFEVATSKVDDIIVNSYYLPEDTVGGKRVLRWAADALEFFTELLGPYPFAEFDVVATPTVAGGIEYPGLIAMPISNYDDTSGRFQWSTVHEVAHQWWYSLVGNDQQDEPWLDEALTQYSTALFYELHEGWEGAVSEVLEPRYQRVAGTDEDDLISRPVAAYTESNYGPVVYGKGPLFFHALRQEAGEKAFTAILQAYFDTFRYQIANGMDFLDLAETISEQELADLYQEWLGDVAKAGP